MDFMKLISEANAAGLSVRADGDKLVVRGPRSAEAIVQRLMAHKEEVLAIVRTTCHLSPKPPSSSKIAGVPETTHRVHPAAEVGACKLCGCALGWQTEDGRIACAECEPKPPAADMLVLVDTDAGPVWRRFDDERSVEFRQVDGPDPWEAAMPWDAMTPSCPTCKSAEGWTDALDHWHCWKCRPPFRTEKLLNDRERLLRTAWRKAKRRQGGPES